MSRYVNYSEYEDYNLSYSMKESFSLHKDPIFNQEEWKELALWYLNLEQQTIAELELSLADTDFPRLITLGDQIYGHAGSFGFENISLLGKKIEIAAINNNTTLLTYLISFLKSYINILLLEIDSTLVHPTTNF